MRKFARSIGSEGKSPGQQGRTVTPFAVPVRRAVCGLARKHVASDSDVGRGGYLSEVVLLPARPPLGTVAMPRFRVKPGAGNQRRANNCQLRTAYGGESNCIIKT